MLHDLPRGAVVGITEVPGRIGAARGSAHGANGSQGRVGAGSGAQVRRCAPGEAREKGGGRLWGPPPHEGRSEKYRGWGAHGQGRGALPPGALQVPTLLRRDARGAVPGPGARRRLPCSSADGHWRAPGTAADSGAGSEHVF